MYDYVAVTKDAAPRIKWTFYEPVNVNRSPFPRQDPPQRQCSAQPYFR